VGYSDQVEYQVSGVQERGRGRLGCGSGDYGGSELDFSLGGAYPDLRTRAGGRGGRRTCAGLAVGMERPEAFGTENASVSGRIRIENSKTEGDAHVPLDGGKTLGKTEDPRGLVEESTISVAMPVGFDGTWSLAA
jgi:hypothetical protein